MHWKSDSCSLLFLISSFILGSLLTISRGMSVCVGMVIWFFVNIDDFDQIFWCFFFALYWLTPCTTCPFSSSSEKFLSIYKMCPNVYANTWWMMVILGPNESTSGCNVSFSSFLLFFFYSNRSFHSPLYGDKIWINSIHSIYWVHTVYNFEHSTPPHTRITFWIVSVIRNKCIIPKYMQSVSLVNYFKVVFLFYFVICSIFFMLPHHFCCCFWLLSLCVLI